MVAVAPCEMRMRVRVVVVVPIVMGVRSVAMLVTRMRRAAALDGVSFVWRHAPTPRGRPVATIGNH